MAGKAREERPADQHGGPVSFESGWKKGRGGKNAVRPGQHLGGTEQRYLCLGLKRQRSKGRHTASKGNFHGNEEQHLRRVDGTVARTRKTRTLKGGVNRGGKFGRNPPTLNFRGAQKNTWTEKVTSRAKEGGNDTRPMAGRGKGPCPEASGAKFDGSQRRRDELGTPST